MKEKMILPALFAVLFATVLPAAAQTSAAENVVERDGLSYLEQVYEVPENTDPAALVQEQVEKDGVTWQYDSHEVEVIPGTVTEREVREPLVYHTTDSDLAAVTAAQAPTLEYDRDGYTGTLTLDSAPASVTELPQATAGPDTEAVPPQEGGDGTISYAPAPVYEYTFWYTGTVALRGQDRMRVTVRYLAQTDPTPSPAPESWLPAFSLPDIPVPECLLQWLPGDFLPEGIIPGIWAAGAAILALVILTVLLVLVLRRRRKKKKQAAEMPLPGEIKPLEDPEPDTESAVPAPPRKMPVPVFLRNMDRRSALPDEDDE